jgi:hypothetical protein
LTGGVPGRSIRLQHRQHVARGARFDLGAQKRDDRGDRGVNGRERDGLAEHRFELPCALGLHGNRELRDPRGLSNRAIGQVAQRLQP